MSFWLIPLIVLSYWRYKQVVSRHQIIYLYLSVEKVFVIDEHSGKILVRKCSVQSAEKKIASLQNCCVCSCSFFAVISWRCMHAIYMLTTVHPFLPENNSTEKKWTAQDFKNPSKKTSPCLKLITFFWRLSSTEKVSRIGWWSEKLWFYCAAFEELDRIFKKKEK